MERRNTKEHKTKEHLELMQNSDPEAALSVEDMEEIIKEIEKRYHAEVDDELRHLEKMGPILYEIRKEKMKLNKIGLNPDDNNIDRVEFAIWKKLLKASREFFPRSIPLRKTMLHPLVFYESIFFL